MNTRYTVQTSITPAGNIVQETTAHEPGLADLRDQIVQRVSRQVIDLQDAAIRDALIALGWTPPGQTNDTALLAWVLKQWRCDPKMDGQHVYWGGLTRPVKGNTAREAIANAIKEGR